ncbi:hypothetical protein [Pedobacter immunditicola]|uniref:hypothetical protein n=1 Tax=Pedobacter immunditicola TaxID=3133440 RepID=UPI0030AB53A0
MIQLKKGTKYVWKWLAGIFLALVIVLGSAALYFSLRWKPLLTEKIKSGIYYGSYHLYKIDFKDIHLNLLTGTASLDSVTLLADTAVYRNLRKNNLAPAHLLDLKLKQLKVSGAGILTAYFKKKLEIDAIILNKPELRIIYQKVEKRPDTLVDERTLFHEISKSLKSIHVGKLNIVNAELDYINAAIGRKQNTVQLLNVEVQDFLLDATSHEDHSRVYYAKEIAFELIGFRSLTKDRMYTLKADTITGSAKNKTLFISDLQLIPAHKDLAFTRKYKTQKDRYDLHFQELAFRGIDFVKLNHDGSLHAQSLTLGPGKAGIFMNRELPPPAFDKGKNYPHLALKRLPLPLHLDTLNINDIHVAYTEYNPITQKRGTVDLHHLKGEILNVTNDSAMLVKNNHAIANLSARIIEAATINVRLDFNLTANDGAFSYSGQIGPMDMTALNPLSRSLGLVKIEEGRVRKADFNINGNLKGSSGTLRFHYDDLKVTLLKEGEDGEPAKEKGFLSFLANTIIIESSNPAEGQEPRVAKVKFERTPAASFFNLLWKSVFVGIRETIGIGMVPVKSPEKAFEKVAEKKLDRQEKRKERKEARIKKRKQKEAEKALEKAAQGAIVKDK